jgi:hypothetical protein
MAGKMTRPMTTAELFEKVCEILKENGQMPDILDYGLAESHPIPITTYEFEIRNNLDYGGSEGIYLDLWIEKYTDEERENCKLGTFKTLADTPEAMRTMAQLLADFIVAENKYVNKNLDDFTWEGADVHAIENGKKLDWGYSCGTMESAIRKKNELLKKYGRVVIRDNRTRKESFYKKEGAVNDSIERQ